MKEKIKKFLLVLISTFVVIAFSFLLFQTETHRCRTAAKMLDYKNPKYNSFVGCVMETKNNQKVILDKLIFFQQEDQSIILKETENDCE